MKRPHPLQIVVALLISGIGIGATVITYEWFIITFSPLSSALMALGTALMFSAIGYLVWIIIGRRHGDPNDPYRW